MALHVMTTDIPDLLIFEPQFFGDHRGWFLETWQKQKYSNLGLTANFVQDNMSFSKKGTLRGLHMQNPAQGKLVQVVQGSIFDVAVDLRKNSLTFGQWYGLILSDEKKNQFWIPEGFAHGFLVLSDVALFSYKCTEYYNPKDEITLLWNDPDVAINWPLHLLNHIEPLLSDKDQNGKRLCDLIV